MIKIAATSDLHGNLPTITEEVDYLLIAGDIVPLDSQFYTKGSKRWLKNVFLPWCKTLPVKEKILVVAGNHDFYLQRHGMTDLLVDYHDLVEYLDNTLYVDDNLQVFGTPWCHQFGNWAFMDSEANLQTKFQEFTEDLFEQGKLSIILSHDAPYGTSDVLLEETMYTNPKSDPHKGCKALADLIRRTRPTWNIHGHLHSTDHEVEMLGNTRVICVSLLGESYSIDYPITYINIQ